MVSRRSIQVLVASVWLITGCRGSRSAEPDSLVVNAAAAVTTDNGECSDVADVRVCWGGVAVVGSECESGDFGTICVSDRELPTRSQPVAGWRCAGVGADRSCFDRGLRAGRFECVGKTCTQRYPRMPDDGEWECIEMEGVVMCRRGVTPAGVITGPPDSGWFCGLRAGTETGERICVDFSADLPTGAERGWRCRYDHSRRERKICKPAPAGPALGASCDHASPCPDRLVCAVGRCLPAAPAVQCWFDKDCEGGECHLGTCAGTRR